MTARTFGGGGEDRSRRHAATICQHSECGQRLDAHALVQSHPNTRPRRLCPGGEGRRFRHPGCKTRASLSLSERETKAVAEMLHGLMTGKDLRIAARMAAPQLLSVRQKLERASAGIAKRKAGKAEAAE